MRILSIGNSFSDDAQRYLHRGEEIVLKVARRIYHNGVGAIGDNDAPIAVDLGKTFGAFLFKVAPVGSVNHGEALSELIVDFFRISHS